MSINDNLNPNEIKNEFLDNNLRPTLLGDFLGQEKLKENLSIFINAAKKEMKRSIILYFMDLLDLVKQH